MAENKKLSIIAFSGDFDKLTAVFTLGTGAAAVGYEVNIFFTFWGLDAIKKKQGRSFTGSNWHSHPASPSRPSQEDLRLANDPTIRYAILSLLDGEPKLNSFKILNGEVVDKEIHL